jgi:hypothetical protein
LASCLEEFSIRKRNAVSHCYFDKMLQMMPMSDKRQSQTSCYLVLPSGARTFASANFRVQTTAVQIFYSVFGLGVVDIIVYHLLLVVTQNRVLRRDGDVICRCVTIGVVRPTTRKTGRCRLSLCRNSATRYFHFQLRKTLYSEINNSV